MGNSNMQYSIIHQLQHPPANKYMNEITKVNSMQMEVLLVTRTISKLYN